MAYTTRTLKAMAVCEELDRNEWPSQECLAKCLEIADRMENSVQPCILHEKQIIIHILKKYVEMYQFVGQVAEFAEV